MGNPHKHAEVIKAWADGSEIEYRNPNLMLTSMPPKRDPWKAVQPDHAWNEFWEYRIKPAPPKYPRTRMTNADYAEVLNCGDKFNLLGCENIANAAIARAIEDGQVVPVEEVPGARLLFKTELAELVPAAMLEEVARHAAAYGYNQAGGHIGLYLGSDFYDLIAKVKEGK